MRSGHRLGGSADRRQFNRSISPVRQNPLDSLTRSEICADRPCTEAATDLAAQRCLIGYFG